ncbi:YncE family protein [Mycobacterium shimoidei]|uniref:Uncharacterized protein n=1 Tax=Mycobacterium shimoidei TaxID=29313 RepID=A0A1E3T5D8_MYCSH|nr:YncE family protein [Mycobacterium shimoidei]MCV7259672.1 YncE family protein [Mycobacterium shimoidei]ODR09585.1 hypothetical protein BHQ16_19445 [Mycobacterium shimoidei]ORW76631.1 hypothetical protein AWC26_20455 [Mycobacterium shimoidei]SRX93939.1 hypothetical protein MSP7336_02186 [Mycobacterium shimoidei]
MGAKNQKTGRADTPPGFSYVGEVAVHQGPVGDIAVSADGGRVVVTNSGNDSISLIDYRGHEPFIRTLTGLDEPFALAIAGERAYVSTVWPAYDAIAVIDMGTNYVVDVHPVAHSIADLAVSPDGAHLYVARTGSGGADVAVLHTATGQLEAIGAAETPGTVAQCVRVSPNGRRIYLATNTASGGNLAVIDAGQSRVIDIVEIGSPIRDVAISPDGGTAYVASCGPDFGAVLDVIDTGSNAVICTHKIPEISGWLTQLVVSRDGARAYLVADEGVAVLGIPTHEVIGTIAVGRAPSCVSESPDGTRLYIADYTGALAVVESASASGSTIGSADDEPTVANEWFLPELPQLESA